MGMEDTLLDNVISLRLFKEQDPILRKGDLVRFIDMEEYASQGFDEGVLDEMERDLAQSLEGHCGIVTAICLVLPPSHETAPGQAMYVDVAVPIEDGWEEFDAISVEHLHRVLGHESDELRGYGNA
jgi:hypothetical protein